jgi:hypothetical protein
MGAKIRYKPQAARGSCKFGTQSIAASHKLQAAREKLTPYHFLFMEYCSNFISLPNKRLFQNIHSSSGAIPVLKSKK